MRLYSRGQAATIEKPVMGKLTRHPVSDPECRSDYIIFGDPRALAGFAGDVSGYAGVFDPAGVMNTQGLPVVTGAPHLSYLEEDDVVLLLPSGSVNVLYRRRSEHNTILVTERCNSFCLMCSQPPREVDDSHRVGEILRLLELIDPHTREIGLSGGEPTLLGDALLKILSKAREVLPTTALHMLTNGRRFLNSDYAQRLGAIAHPDLMLGIPLYSDLDYLHDYVVQARGAFQETVAGLYNLASAGVRVEIRVVLHAQTVERLPELAEFIGRNLPFVSHVALMGLEMFGFTHKNLPVLWIDPVDYAPQLEQATKTLALHGLNTSIYNHQLCTIPRTLWPFARKSISDWKNVYLDACGDCGMREYCGGFFQSATKRHSSHIRALPPPSPEAGRFLREWHGWEEPGEPLAAAR
jgi:His-Xaa-Ser system radical SAM maturase HxsC